MTQLLRPDQQPEHHNSTVPPREHRSPRPWMSPRERGYLFLAGRQHGRALDAGCVGAGRRHAAGWCLGGLVLVPGRLRRVPRDRPSKQTHQPSVATASKQESSHGPRHQDESDDDEDDDCGDVLAGTVLPIDKPATVGNRKEHAPLDCPDRRVRNRNDGANPGWMRQARESLIYGPYMRPMPATLNTAVSRPRLQRCPRSVHSLSVAPVRAPVVRPTIRTPGEAKHFWIRRFAG